MIERSGERRMTRRGLLRGLLGGAAVASFVGAGVARNVWETGIEFRCYFNSNFYTPRAGAPAMVVTKVDREKGEIHLS